MTEFGVEGESVLQITDGEREQSTFLRRGVSSTVPRYEFALTPSWNCRCNVVLRRSMCRDAGVSLRRVQVELHGGCIAGVTDVDVTQSSVQPHRRVRFLHAETEGCNTL